METTNTGTKILKAAPLLEATIQELKNKTEQLREKGHIPYLKIIIVGNNPSSLIYTKNKKIFSEKINAKCDLISLDENVSEDIFRKTILEISKEEDVHGLLVQLPLPNHLQHIDIHNLIPPNKDVDGFNYINLGKLMAGNDKEVFTPCTPKGILQLLKHYQIDIKGKNVAIIGRSLIVGKPLSALFTNHHATVTLCHSQTSNIKEITKQADIIVVAIGKPKFLTKEYLSDHKKQVVIDVGINSLPNKKLCGDAHFDEIKEHVAAITPVPGGVGPLTIMSLTQNLLNATERSIPH